MRALVSADYCERLTPLIARSIATGSSPGARVGEAAIRITGKIVET
jgi:hypothetical protein